MHFEVPINSNLFNTLEYVVFDLVLAIFVYVLTSRLVGLYNCYDALKNHRKSHICEDTRAPLFETGIVCTRRKVFYGIVVIRILSWVLIFSTNLLILGRSEKIIETTTASVTTLGRFSAFDSTELLRQRQFLRKACVGRTEKSYYYGEIRNGSCETDRKLFSRPTVEFDFNFKPTFLSTSGCGTKNGSVASHQRFECNNPEAATKATTISSIVCTENTTNGETIDELCFQNGTAPFTPCVRKAPVVQLKNVPFDCGAGGNKQRAICDEEVFSNVTFSICDNAVIVCRYEPIDSNCVGFVNINATTHICENLKLGDQQNTNASCKKASGAVWNTTDWVSFYGVRALNSISNVMAVAYGSGEERREVKQYAAKDERSLTSVNMLWTGALAAKIIMVVALYVVCELLSRRYGVFMVANDEPRILSLLTSTVTRIRRGRAPRAERDDIKLRVALHNDGVVRLHDGHEDAFE